MPPALQKKICMLGAVATGKTSLVRRWVESMFSDKYLATVGVKIDRKLVEVDGREMNLLLWDLQGEEQYQRTRLSYLRGASGCLLVVDGTRPATFRVAEALYQTVTQNLGPIPCIFVLNKTDLTDAWKITDDMVAPLLAAGHTVIRTSAKSGEGVEEAFRTLAKRLLDPASSAEAPNSVGTS